VASDEPGQQAVIDAAIGRLKGEPGPLLLVLHAVQDALGHIPPAAVPQIAAGLNLSRAEVHGVVTFYHYFRSHPPGRTTLEICRAEACQAVGGAALAEHARRQLGVDFHASRPTGRSRSRRSTASATAPAGPRSASAASCTAA